MLITTKKKRSEAKEGERQQYTMCVYTRTHLNDTLFILLFLKFNNKLTK